MPKRMLYQAPDVWRTGRPEAWETDVSGHVRQHSRKGFVLVHRHTRQIPSAYEHPRVMYHGTQPQRVQSIMEKGLLPTRGMAQSNFPWVGTERILGKVWLTPSRRTARWMAANAQEHPEVYSLLEVDTKGLPLVPNAEFMADPEEVWPSEYNRIYRGETEVTPRLPEYYSMRPIPPPRIRKVEEAATYPHRNLEI
jgi:hypothetical protein